MNLKLTPEQLAALKWLLRWDGKEPVPEQHLVPIMQLDYQLNPEHHTL